ncbi:PilW family protein [Hydrogenophaga sp. 2FB]|uniref:PilW family protein n=1 Tax=Hydrogenophaga sp. 2FB TaxID=2502187 RepID=UPI0010F6E908|nr:PilW family protein [Hydrogenophaga sp. 2FB]
MRLFPRRTTRHAPSFVVHQRGMSLVELMVAMAIGLFLVGAVAAIYVAAANGSRASTLESQMNEDASLALEILQQQLRLAGYSDLDAKGERKFRGVGARGCDGGFSDNTADQDFDAMACSTASTGPDAIAVRYEATLLNTQPVTDLTTSVLQPANCSFIGISAWDIGAGVTIPLADNRYYIAADGNNDGVPTLFCKGKNGSPTSGGFAAATALIPNIEDMQITYAVTTAPSTDLLHGNRIPRGGPSWWWPQAFCSAMEI